MSESTDLVPKQSEAVVETSATAVAAREKAAVEARFVMAMNRPRNPEVARQSILKACQRPRFAESAMYSKPVGGRAITGLSVRFAEEVSRLWGNILIQSTITFDDRERRMYKVVATDLETNTAHDQDVVVEKFVERRKIKDGDEVISSRQNKNGQTVYLKAATDDEILNKCNAALSKAKRNLALTLIPSDIREEAEETIIATVRDRDAKDPDGARKKLLDSFFQLGVSADQVQALIGKPLQQLNPAEIQWLRGAYTALKDGEASWADIASEPAFNRGSEKKKEEGDGKKGSAGLKQRVAKKADGKKAAKKKDDTPKAANEAGNEPQPEKAKELTEEQAEAAAIADVEDDEEARIRAEEEQMALEDK
jgi:hypothetical protein